MRGGRAVGRGAVRGGKAVARLWLVFAVLVVWELVTRLLQDTDFPPPTTIVDRMYELWFAGPPSRLFLTDDAIGHILPSLGRMFSGWVLAALVGVVAGVMLGRSRAATDYVDALFEFGRAIPPPLLLPLFVVLFQAGGPTQLATIVFGVIWPVLLNSIDGARAVDRTYTETATVFGLSRAQRLRVVIIPAASPKIFAGLRLSLSLALILMVISELFGGTDGIGYQLLQAQRGFDTPAVWATIALLGVLGYVVNSLFVLAEHRLLGWHRHATRNV
ncbi:ABC transporter permease [Nonomuraea sp. NN258]|nr:ABC transporter permease [Nonomuraea antri]